MESGSNDESKVVAITGGSGRLGRALKEVFPAALTPSHEEMDILEADSIHNYLKSHSVDILIHAAALTSAKGCQQNHRKAWTVNVEGSYNVLSSFKSVNPQGRMVYLSTPAVFDCNSGGYSEFDTPDPVNYYGFTKLCGEQAVRGFSGVTIVRTNFVERGRWPYEEAFVDRFGTYLYADEVAVGIKEIIIANPGKEIVHICGNRKFSMYELATLIDSRVGMKTLDGCEGITIPIDMSLITKVWHPYILGGVHVGDHT